MIKFIDKAKIHLKAGDGGHGCIAFLREKFRPQGGPCGGDGGKGGSIILQVDPQLTTLQDVSYKRHCKAERGQHGLGKNMHGKSGKDLILLVPAGTTVKNEETEQVIVDMTENGEVFTICKGGNGGFGNARFKTQMQTAPRVANDGQLGEALTVNLELKVMADVGLVGFPNAGKSTLISAISNARPKIADYPFTTLAPNLGIIKYGDYNSFVMADIPGLIEGAAEGKGLGSQFLRHIERTRVLVFLVDGMSENIKEQYGILRGELERHQPELNTRPSLLLITKLDATLDGFIDEQELPTIDTIRISSVSRLNLEIAIIKISKLLVSQHNPQAAVN
jgi:GTP-binding protein|tara:strand:+ start:376 stop:1380 length:1005 start_codon:yes stop_codon:yes gene_type:complete